MKKLSVLFSILILAACSSKKAKHDPKPEIHHTGAETKWDHEQIRKVREQESAQKPSAEEEKQWAEDDANCISMSREQMIRSKASGCRPLDPREGRGEDSFCCPQSKK